MFVISEFTATTFLDKTIGSGTMETVLVHNDSADKFQTHCKASSTELISRRTSALNPNDKAIALQNSRLQEKIKKQARTHALLVSIVVVFASSWFPLNLLNVVLDVFGFMEISLLVSTSYQMI